MTDQQVKALKKLCPVKFNQQDLEKTLTNAEILAISNNKTKKLTFASQFELVQEAFSQGKAGSVLDLSKFKFPTSNSFHVITPPAELEVMVSAAIDNARSLYMTELENRQKQWLESELSSLLVAKEHKATARKEAEKEKLFKSLLSVINE